MNLPDLVIGHIDHQAEFHVRLIHLGDHVIKGIIGQGGCIGVPGAKDQAIVVEAIAFGPRHRIGRWRAGPAPVYFRRLRCGRSFRHANFKIDDFAHLRFLLFVNLLVDDCYTAR